MGVFSACVIAFLGWIQQASIAANFTVKNPIWYYLSPKISKWSSVRSATVTLAARSWLTDWAITSLATTELAKLNSEHRPPWWYKTHAIGYTWWFTEGWWGEGGRWTSKYPFTRPSVINHHTYIYICNNPSIPTVPTMVIISRSFDMHLYLDNTYTSKMF